mgnify:CR=1 FL=1
MATPELLYSARLLGILPKHEKNGAFTWRCRHGRTIIKRSVYNLGGIGVS